MSGKLPPFVYYDIDRAVVSSLMEREVGTHANYDHLFEWFYASENEELRLQRKGPDQNTTLGDLDAVRWAICSMIRGASEPHIEMGPPRLVASLDGTEFSFEQLSDGYRNVLALAADIAWQMAREHEPPDRHSPQSEAVVLIDEVELHLHPAWQQRILPNLIETFPNAQFVVSTHSPQVLSTIHPQHVVELATENGNIVADGASSATYGAESGDILTSVMGMEPRPDNGFTQELRKYRRLISDDCGETEEAQRIRKTLEQLSPHDPALDVADLEIRQRQLFRKPRSTE